MPSLPRIHPSLALAIIALSVTLQPSRGLADEASSRVVFQGPERVVSGARFESSLGIDPLDSKVLSWALSASLEGLRVLDITTAETDFAQLAADGFAEIQILEDGSAFGSIGVLSFAGGAVLPPGTSTLLRSVQEVARKEPGVGHIAPLDAFPWPEGEPISNRVLLEGGDTMPLSFDEVVLDVTGCAELALEAEEAFAVEPNSTVEVARGARVAVRVLVGVPSADHLHPSGVSFGLAHDPTVLALETVRLETAVTDAFVKPDGYSRVEQDEAGFSVAVLSSATDPSILGEGTHRVATASYRFLGTEPPGESYDARFEWIDGGETSGVAVRTEFLPEGAEPCTLEGWTLTVRVAPDEWIRGDSNGDGKVDISDPITSLGHLFLGQPASCESGMEVNSDAKVDLSDAVYLLNHLFLAGPEPEAPYPDCGWVPSSLSCERSVCRP